MTALSLTATFWLWLRSDRVRISPREGALYRLPPSTIVALDGRLLEVRGRRIESLAGGPLIVYDCISAGQPCELRVAVASSRLTLAVGANESVHGHDDAEIFLTNG